MTLTSSCIVCPSDVKITSSRERRVGINQYTTAYARLCDPPLQGCQCPAASHGQKLVIIELGVSMDDVNMVTNNGRRIGLQEGHHQRVQPSSESINCLKAWT
jgi:hypothetical protein